MQTAQTTTSYSANDVRVTRVIAAPRQAVWDAWTQPAGFSQWFGIAPYSTPQSRISMDVRPGGEWSATQVSADDGAELPFRGHYLAVVEPQRLELTFEDPADPNNPQFECATITFAELDGSTEIRCAERAPGRPSNTSSSPTGIRHSSTGSPPTWNGADRGD